MEIFIVGVVMFVVGAALNAAGWSWHRRTVAETPPELIEWFVDTLREWFPRMVGPDRTGGERLAAFGALLSGLGIVAAVAGIFAWAQE